MQADATLPRQNSSFPTRNVSKRDFFSHIAICEWEQVGLSKSQVGPAPTHDCFQRCTDKATDGKSDLTRDIPLLHAEGIENTPDHQVVLEGIPVLSVVHRHGMKRVRTNIFNTSDLQQAPEIQVRLKSLGLSQNMNGSIPA